MRSKFEEKLANGVCSGLPYETVQIPYKREHTYTPDFKLETDGVTYLVEAKGAFKHLEIIGKNKVYVNDDPSKYIWIRKSLQHKYELVFLFQNPLTAMPNAKVRKDGTKYTVSEWADKNNFKWFTEETFLQFRDVVEV